MRRTWESATSEERTAYRAKTQELAAAYRARQEEEAAGQAVRWITPASAALDFRVLFGAQVRSHPIIEERL
jgi:hypothetical protein